jgi:hypothetical protein
MARFWMPRRWPNGFRRTDSPARSTTWTPEWAGEMQTTMTLKKVSCGTELEVVQQGVPAAIAAEAYYLGWQESLVLLPKLVEAEIPDQP